MTPAVRAILLRGAAAPSGGGGGGGAGTWDSTVESGFITYSNGNLTAAITGANAYNARGSSGVTADGTYTASFTMTGTVTGYKLAFGVMNDTESTHDVPPGDANATYQWFDGIVQGAGSGTGPGFTNSDTVTVELTISGGTRTVKFKKNAGAFSSAFTAPASGALKFGAFMVNGGALSATITSASW